MIKNIVFDMGKVLIRYDARSYTEKFVKEKEAATLLCQEIFQSVEWIQLDRGIISEEEAIAAMKERIPEKYHKEVTFLVENWHEEIPPYREMEEFAKELKEKGYHLFLLSNTSKRFHRFRVHIPALQHFDGEFISADYQMVKPELRIFETFYEKFQLDPKECFFIDDNNANIEAAVFTGMKGFIFRGDLEKCREAMRKEGIQV